MTWNFGVIVLILGLEILLVLGLSGNYSCFRTLEILLFLGLSGIYFGTGIILVLRLELFLFWDFGGIILVVRLWRFILVW